MEKDRTPSTISTVSVPVLEDEKHERAKEPLPVRPPPQAAAAARWFLSACSFRYPTPGRRGRQGMGLIPVPPWERG